MREGYTMNHCSLSKKQNQGCQMKRLTAACIALFIVSLMVTVYAQNNFKRSSTIQFSLTSIALTEGGPMVEGRKFRPGQTVWVNLKVRGVTKDDKKDVNFQADLLLKADDGRIVLDKKNILNQSLHAGDITPVLNTTYNIDLGQGIAAGKYHIEITFRDMSAGTYNKFNDWFDVVTP